MDTVSPSLLEHQFVWVGKLCTANALCICGASIKGRYAKGNAKYGNGD